MKAYFVGTDVSLSLVEHDREIARAMLRGIAGGGFGAATVAALWLWPAHPVWSFVIGFFIGAPIGGVTALVLRTPQCQEKTCRATG